MDTIALTYRELADRLGIKPESARKTAQRKRWHRFTANDGTARVHVPLEALAVPETVPVDVPAASVPAMEARITMLEALLDEVRATNISLRDLAEAERRRADEWKELAERPWWKRLVA